MNNNLVFNISNNNTKFIQELKYQVRNNTKKHALETAQEVESLFIQMLIKNMRDSLSKENFLDNDQSRLYTEIYDEKISQEMSKRGVGLTDIILKQIKSNGKNN